MAEYIEREAAIEKIADYCELRKAIYKNSEDEFLRGLQTALKAVTYNDVIPTADVQPIRRGKWIIDKDFYTCSRCNHQYLIDKILSMTIYPSGGMPYYCPCCGADMREADATKG